MALAGHGGNQTKRGWRLIGLALASVGLLVTIVFVLIAFHYFLLWKPSLQGKCGRIPEREPPRLARFRGQVVGKRLWIIQYRWLRRRFTPAGTTLDVDRELPSTIYQGNVIEHEERVKTVLIDGSGRFDFGDLVPGKYVLTVSYPGEDAVDFGFLIDPSANSRNVLIDASPAYYCNCCGWNFEPR